MGALVQDYLVLDVVGTPLASEPFRFASWRNAIPSEMAKRLTEEFPTTGFERSERRRGGNKTYSFKVRKAVDKNRRLDAVDSLSPAWQSFIEILIGPDYRRVVGKAVGECLDDYEIDVGFFVFTSGNDVSIHTDHLAKATTNVLYFAQHWKPEWGGIFSLYRQDESGHFESFQNFSPETGNAILLVPSASSWHGVSAVSPRAEAQRRTLQIEIWRP